MKMDIKSTVIVFDLDDTLYKEADYHASGVSFVAKRIKKLYGVEVDDFLHYTISVGERDLWGALCKELKLPDAVKSSIVWEYRLHNPVISLAPSVIELLEWLQQQSAGLAILTDGRSITQRLKAAALGLSKIPIYISEEYGAPKPDPARFQLIEKVNPDKKYIYIGDNPQKDFLAPNNLGWTTLGLHGDARNIHSQDIENIDSGYLPHRWISKLEELRSLTC